MKKLRAIVIAVSLVIVLWAGMLITDTVKSQNFVEPVFAREQISPPGDNTKLYHGIGYTVKTEYYTNENGERYPGCSEVYLFGKPFAAVIT